MPDPLASPGAGDVQRAVGGLDDGRIVGRPRRSGRVMRIFANEAPLSLMRARTAGSCVTPVGGSAGRSPYTRAAMGCGSGYAQWLDCDGGCRAGTSAAAAGRPEQKEAAPLIPPGRGRPRPPHANFVGARRTRVSHSPRCTYRGGDPGPLESVRSPGREGRPLAAAPSAHASSWPPPRSIVRPAGHLLRHPAVLQQSA